MGRHHIGIVIPALNEAATISDIAAMVGQYGIPIVVDDGSTDDTAKLAAQAGATVVSREKNGGYDAALNSGFEKAAEMDCSYILTIDADGQHDPSLLQKFIEELDAGADVVVGIRSRKQRFCEHLCAFYANLRFGIRDPFCGMKAYRTKVFRALGHFDSYKSTGTELALFAAQNGYKVVQIPFLVRERMASTPRFGSTFRANMRLLHSMMYPIIKDLKAVAYFAIHRP